MSTADSPSEGSFASPPHSATPVPSAQPRRYHDFLLLGKHGWWRGLLAIVSFVAAYFLVSTILSGVGLAFDVFTGRLTVDQLAAGELSLSPALMLMNNLSLAAMLPVAGLLQWAFFGVRPGRLSSVVGRFRWRWMLRSAVIIVPFWVLYIGLSFLVAPLPSLGSLSADAIALVVIVLLTTPFQAAGEEYGARGLLNRSAASWSTNPRIGFVLGAVVSSLLFAAAHLAGDVWLIAYYIVFGVALCFVATATGGLEAAVLIHAVNNVLLLVPAVLAGEQDSVFDRQAGVGGPFMLVPMAMLVIAALLVTWWARRSRVETAAALPPTGPAASVPASGPTAE